MENPRITVSLRTKKVLDKQAKKMGVSVKELVDSLVWGIDRIVQLEYIMDQFRNIPNVK